MCFFLCIHPVVALRSGRVRPQGVTLTDPCPHTCPWRSAQVRSDCGKPVSTNKDRQCAPIQGPSTADVIEEEGHAPRAPPPCYVIVI